MLKNIVKCAYKECEESFYTELDESKLEVGETYIIGCPKCGKPIAIDVCEDTAGETPVSETEHEPITVKVPDPGTVVKANTK